MNEYVTYILLGIVQGLTEFLPISSSGHLLLAERLLGYRETSMAYELLLHLATLVAVVWVYRRDIARVVASLFAPKDKSEGRRSDCSLFTWVVVATIVTVAIAIPFKDFFEALKNKPFILLEVGIELVVTGTLLVILDRIRPKIAGSFDGRWWKAVPVGVAQAIAIFPAISRSGSTVFASVVVGLGREDAARFSFLLSIPVILGAAVLDAKSIESALDLSLAPALLGMAAAFVSGVLAIRWLISLLVKCRLTGFAVWCYLMALLSFYLYYGGR